MTPLMYHKEFPATDWINDYKFENNNLTKEQNKEATDLIKNYLSGSQNSILKRILHSFLTKIKTFTRWNN
jgi:hypothetical protein